MSDWSAELDQMLADLRDIAKALAIYVGDLEAQGFSRSEALRIAIAWQTTMLGGAKDDDNERGTP